MGSLAASPSVACTQHLFVWSIENPALDSHYRLSAFSLKQLSQNPQRPLKEKKKGMQMEIALEAKMNIVASHEIPATLGQTIFYFG